MRVLVCLVIAVAVNVGAVRPSTGKLRNKSLDELKDTLKQIRSNLLSMKSTLNVAAGFVDGFAERKPVGTLEAVNQAFARLEEENIPHHCMQEATLKLNEIKSAVVPNCSALHIVEDTGAMAYNTLGLTATTMVILDNLLNGYQECRPWYKFWHYIPCIIEYAFTSYKEVTGIIHAAVTTWNENNNRAKDIEYQVFCKPSPVSLKITTDQVLNEAYLCSKKPMATY